MNWTRIATMSVMGGTLVTLLARASTSVTPPSTVAPVDVASDAHAAMFPEVERLRERLRASVVPAAPARNLFAFKSETRRVTASNAAVPPARIELAADPAPAARTPAFKFVGLAEDASPDGPVRTAILSSSRDLMFARVGDVVGGYRVSAIGPDALELVATDDGSSFVLSLK